MIRILRVFIPVGALTLLIPEILLIVASFVVASYLMLQVDPTVYLLYEGGMLSITVVLVSIMAGLYFQDLYSGIFVKSRIVLLHQLCLAVGIAFLAQGLVSYLFRSMRMPVYMMVVGSFLAMITVFLWRLAFCAFALQREQVLLVGGSSVLTDIGAYIQEHPETGLAITGYVDDAHDLGDPLPGGKLLGPVSALQEIVKATSPQRIIVGMFERRNRVPVSDLLEMRFAGHIIEEAATVYERVCGRVCIKELRPSQLIYSGELGPRRQTLLLQALLNVTLAAIGACVALPFMLIIAIAVKLSSPGPVLYRQARVGQGGEPFTLYKFRSMRADAEAGTGAVWAAKDDPRVTRVGRYLRKLRLDELPQFFNVLRGEMSIVGPRPERPEFVKALSEQIPYYRQRHCVRPGITGWAQINYKYGDTFEDTITKLEYDLYYIKNMSLSLDTYVILHTLKAMMPWRGAQ